MSLEGEGATSKGMGEGQAGGGGSKELAFWACLVWFFLLVILFFAHDFIFCSIYPPYLPPSPH